MELLLLVLIVSVSKTDGHASTVQTQYSVGYAQSFVEDFSQAFAASFGGQLTGLLKKLPDISRTDQYNQQDEPDVTVFVVEYQDPPKEPRRGRPDLHRGQQFQGQPSLHNGEEPQGHIRPYQGQHPQQPRGHSPVPYHAHQPQGPPPPPRHGHHPDGHLPPTYHRQQTYGQSILQQVQQPYGHPPPAQQGPHPHRYMPPPQPPQVWAPVSQGVRYTSGSQVGYEHASLIQTQRDEERRMQYEDNPNFANNSGFNNKVVTEQGSVQDAGTSQDTYNYNNQMYYDKNAYYQNNLGRPTHGVGILEGSEGPVERYNQFNQNPKPSESNQGTANHNQLSNNEGLLLNSNSLDKNLSNEPLPLSTKPTVPTLGEGEVSKDSYGEEIPDFVPLYPTGNKQHETLKPEQEEEDFKIDIRFGEP